MIDIFAAIEKAVYVHMIYTFFLSL